MSDYGYQNTGEYIDPNTGRVWSPAEIRAGIKTGEFDTDYATATAAERWTRENPAEATAIVRRSMSADPNYLSNISEKQRKQAEAIEQANKAAEEKARQLELRQNYLAAQAYTVEQAGLEAERQAAALERVRPTVDTPEEIDRYNRDVRRYKQTQTKYEDLYTQYKKERDVVSKDVDAFSKQTDRLSKRIDTYNTQIGTAKLATSRLSKFEQVTGTNILDVKTDKPIVWKSTVSDTGEISTQYTATQITKPELLTAGAVGGKPIYVVGVGQFENVKTETVQENKLFGVIDNPLSGVDEKVSDVLYGHALEHSAGMASLVLDKPVTPYTKEEIKAEQQHLFYETNYKDVFKQYPTSPEVIAKGVFESNRGKLQFLHGFSMSYMDRPVTEAALFGVGAGVGKVVSFGSTFVSGLAKAGKITKYTETGIRNIAKATGIGVGVASVGVGSYEVYKSPTPMKTAGEMTADAVSFTTGFMIGSAPPLPSKTETEIGFKTQLASKEDMWMGEYRRYEAAGKIDYKQSYKLSNYEKQQLVNKLKMDEMFGVAKRTRLQTQSQKQAVELPYYKESVGKLVKIKQPTQVTATATDMFAVVLATGKSKPFKTPQLDLGIDTNRFASLQQTKIDTRSKNVTSHLDVSINNRQLQATVTPVSYRQRTRLDVRTRQDLKLDQVVDTPIDITTDLFQTQFTIKQFTITPPKPPKVVVTPVIFPPIITKPVVKKPPTPKKSAYRYKPPKIRGYSFVEKVPTWSPMEAMFGKKRKTKMGKIKWI